MQIIIDNNNNNMKVTVVPTVVGALETIPKGLVKGLKDLKKKKKG